MTTTVVRHGDQLAVLIPHELATELRLEADHTVAVFKTSAQLVVVPRSDRLDLAAERKFELAVEWVHAHLPRAMKELAK